MFKHTKAIVSVCLTTLWGWRLHMFLENPQYVIFRQLLSIMILFPPSNFPSFAQTGFLLHEWYNVPKIWYMKLLSFQNKSRKSFLVKKSTLEIKLFTFSTYYKVAYFPYLVWGSTFTCAETYSKPVKYLRWSSLRQYLTAFSRSKWLSKSSSLTLKCLGGQFDPPVVFWKMYLLKRG